MKARRFVILALVLGCGAIIKPPAPNRRLDIRQTGSVFEANNGYQFAVLPEPRSTVVRLDVRYPVGAADDPVGKEGLAHLVEHLLFEVEYTRGGEQTSISAELGRLALSWNAETHEDYTVYQTLLDPANLTDIIGLEVNRLAVGCAGLTPEIFAREREVVLNELRQRQGASGAQLQRAVIGQLYPPYRGVNSVETVSKLELNDACDFIGAQYQRGKAVVIVSGDVTEKDVQVAASKQFIRLRKRNLAERQTPRAVNPPAGTARIRADLDEPGMFIATWSLPAVGTRDYRLLETAWPSFAGHLEQQAYLFKWGHSAFSTMLGGSHAPVLAVGIYLNSLDNAGDARSAIEGAIRNSFDWLGHDSDDERWRSRMYARAESLLARWESLASRNAMFGDFLMFDTTQELIIGRVAELQKASPGDVRALGERWLGAHQARYLIVEPSGTRPTSTQRTWAGGDDAHATSVDGALADKPLPPPPPRRSPQIERYDLGNGTTIVLWPGGTTPVVRGRLVVDSGWAHDPKGKEGLSSMVGASYVEPDALVFEGRELSIVVDNLVVQLGVELRSPGLPLSDDEKDFVKARLRNRSTIERVKYDADLRAAVYGPQHAYARTPMSERSVDAISHDDLQSWARTHIVGKNATLILTGDFDAGLIKKHIAYNIDQVKSGSDSTDIDFDPPSAQRRYVAGTSARPSPTVELDIEFLSRPGIDADHAKRLVLEAVLDAELSKLRTKEALTYGFYASYGPRKGGGLWRIGGDVDANRAGEAARQVLAIFDELRADPEAYRASFVLARQKVIESLLVSTTDSYSVAQQLTNIARFDLSEAFYDRLPDKVAKLTLQDFHAFLKTELNGRRQVFGAFGNAVAVKVAIDTAKATH